MGGDRIVHPFWARLLPGWAKVVALVAQTTRESHARKRLRGKEWSFHWDSSITSIPETVALFTMGSNVRLSFPCALGLM